jgi:hypothetical protein
MTRELPSIEYLRQIFAYDEDTGSVFWRERPECPKHWNARFAGRKAGAEDGRGYLVISILGRSLKSHRIAWAMHYGEWPADQIDHVNGSRSDNRIANLRVVSDLENRRNQKRYANNSSGVSGVVWRAKAKRWLAHIRVKGKRINIGSFDQFDAAVAARKNVEAEYGFHVNHGR